MPCTTYTDPVCWAAAEAVAVPAVNAAAIASAPPSARVLRRIGAPDRKSVDLLPGLPTPPPWWMHPLPLFRSPEVPRHPARAPVPSARLEGSAPRGPAGVAGRADPPRCGEQDDDRGDRRCDPDRRGRL